jgi:hypothetical protein
MPIKTKIVKVNTNTETELLLAENDLVIKNMSIVYLNDTGSKTVSVYLKETPTSTKKGSIFYRIPVSKTGVYTGNIYLAQNNQLTIEIPDLDTSNGEVVDVVMQYIIF